MNGAYHKRKQTVTSTCYIVMEVFWTLLNAVHDTIQ